MKPSQWITSMDNFAPLILPALKMINPKIIAEVGAAEGGNTRVLYDFLRARQGRLMTIDPFPRGSFVEWVNSTGGVVTHFAEYSLNCIPKIGEVDAWFVDGDHNWYTVFNELRLIDELSRKHAKPAVIFMHDVSWPCGRRDMYYDPSIIPAEYVQPNSNKLGITLDQDATPLGGLKGPYWALKDGGAKNGVLTAVEDFLKSTSTKYYWFHVPALLGLGVLVDATHPMASAIAEFYRPYHNNVLMEMIERDRVHHYLTSVVLNEKLKSISLLVEA